MLKKLTLIFQLLACNIVLAQELDHWHYNRLKPLLSGVISTLGGLSTVSYRGIPYAHAPVGDNRWKKTGPLDWDYHGNNLPSEQINLTNFGSSCPHRLLPEQLAEMSQEEISIINQQSEDCLFLNITRPYGPLPNSFPHLPVIVYLHGGGFVRGTPKMYRYDPNRLAARSYVVVTVQYRLGPLGFFNHPAFNDETSTNDVMGNSNLGLTDQVQALRWVKSNIEKFGGDPDNITIMGDSAGGTSVLSLMTSDIVRYFQEEQGFSLFHKAVAIGPVTNFPVGNNIDKANTVANNFIRSLINDPDKTCNSASSLTQLRGSSFSDLLSINNDDVVTSMVNGVLVKDILRKCVTIAHLNDFFSYTLDANGNILVPEKRNYPYVDGKMLKTNSFPIYSGHEDNFFMDVPLIIGSAYNEAEILNYLETGEITGICEFIKNHSFFENILEADCSFKQGESTITLAQELNTKFYNMVSPSTTDEASVMFRKFYTDGAFGVPIRMIAKNLQKRTAIANRRASNTYNYLYGYVPHRGVQYFSDPARNADPNYSDLVMLDRVKRAGHTNEIFALFGTWDVYLGGAQDIHQEDRNMENYFQTQIRNLAIYGNLENHSLPNWSPVSTSDNIWTFQYFRANDGYVQNRSDNLSTEGLPMYYFNGASSSSYVNTYFSDFYSNLYQSN